MISKRVYFISNSAGWVKIYSFYDELNYHPRSVTWETSWENSYPDVGDEQANVSPTVVLPEMRQRR